MRNENVNLQQNSQLCETAVTSSCAKFHFHATFHAILIHFLFSTRFFYKHFSRKKNPCNNLYAILFAHQFPHNNFHTIISTLKFPRNIFTQHFHATFFSKCVLISIFNYYTNREEDVNLKEKVLRKSAITSNVSALQEVANFGTAFFRLR